jgi:hypothetical protein
MFAALASVGEKAITPANRRHADRKSGLTQANTSGQLHSAKVLQDACFIAVEQVLYGHEKTW